MTEPRHIVRDLSFDISFASETDALAQHNDLAQFLSGRLVAVMDEVLSGASLPDDSVVRIDRLDIDLGNLAGTSYYDEVEKRFRSKLGEALQRKLPTLSQDAATSGQPAHPHRDSEGIVSTAQNELDIVISFLETGHLPWNISASPGRIMDEMLQRAIADAGPSLVLRLQTADNKENLARRLAWQFPGDLLAELARCLDSASAAPSSGDWESTLLNLISGRGTAPDRSDYRALLEKALTSGNSRYVRAFWDSLVAELPDLIAQVVRLAGLRADVRRAMARGLPEPMLRDIAGILEPSEIGFIEEVIHRPELFQQAAREPRDSSPVLESAPVIRSHLWEFTFTYLLVERGSRFNRRAYVASVVRQMAAHGNLGYHDLLVSLSDVLSHIESRSSLRDEMLSLLDELQQEEQAPDVMPDDIDPWEQLFEKALTTGDAGPVRPFWPYLAQAERQRVEQIVRRLGVQSDVRRALARGFPDPMLRDIAEILEPSEIGFIEEVIGRPELFQEAAMEPHESSSVLDSAPVVKSHLWEFTFTYLLVERGSQFNRRTYLASVVRQMAAHENLLHPDLVASLVEVLTKIETRSVLKEEMLSLLDELQQDDAAPDTVEPARDSREELLENALISGDARPIDRYWDDLAHNERRLVERIVRHHGIHANVWHAIAQGFPEAMLRDIAEILEPSEIGFIDEVIRQPKPFQDAAKERGKSIPALNAYLWEATFAYLLSERGTQFNRRSYLGSVVRRIAAHHNLKYEELLSSLASASEGTGAAGSLHREIHLLLADFGATSQIPDQAKLLEQALATGDVDLIAPFWREWIRNDRQLLARLLRHNGNRAGVRRSIAAGFPESILRDIAELLAPGVNGFIEGFLKRESAPDGRARLWEFTLIFLLSEQCGAFDSRSYVASIMRQLATAGNLRFQDLVVSMAARLGEVSTPDTAEKELFRLLREQAEELDSPTASRLPGVRELIRSCELYDVVSSCLVRGEVLPAGELIAAIDELLSKYPWQLLRIMRECRNGIAAWLADAELRRLAEVFILLRSRGIQETLAAFRLRACQVSNKRRYYRRVLDLLIRDLPLDFNPVEGDNRTEDQPEPVQLPLPCALAEMPEELVGITLTRAAELSATELRSLVHTLDRLLAQPPQWLLQLLKEGSNGLGKTLAAILPGRQLARILHLIAAPGWHRVQWMADVIVSACSAGQLISASANVYLLTWRFLFNYPMHEANLPVSDAAFITKFLAHLAEENGYRNAADLGTLVSRELRHDTGLPGDAIRTRVLNILPTTEVTRVPRLKVVPKLPPTPLPPSKKSERSADDGQDIYIRNAGQVLATPYLPRLFGMAGLLEGNGFRDADCAQRGIHLLQYMVDEAVNPPEYLLTLNKILCGLGLDAPVRRDIDLTQAEKDAVDGLLGAMIAHWSILGSTSVRGLRESFLQREGRLRRKDGGWQLLVQSRAFDMLLDKLPWGFSVIRHPWMDSTVYVEWR